MKLKWVGRVRLHFNPIVNKTCHIEYANSVDTYDEKERIVKLRGRNNPPCFLKASKSQQPFAGRSATLSYPPGYPPRQRRDD